MVARACYLMKIDASEGDAAPAMAEINYPISTYCAVAGRCSRASLEAPEQLRFITLGDSLIEDGKLTSSNIINCSKFNDGLTVCGTREGRTRVAIMLTDNPYFLSLSIIL